MNPPRAPILDDNTARIAVEPSKANPPWILVLIATLTGCASGPVAKSAEPPVVGTPEDANESQAERVDSVPEVGLPEPISQAQRACGIRAAQPAELSEDERKRFEASLTQMMAPVEEANHHEYYDRGWNSDWNPSRIVSLETSLVTGGAKLWGQARSLSDVAEFAARAQSLGKTVWISSAVSEEVEVGDGWETVFAFTLFVGAFPDPGNPFAIVDLSNCGQATKPPESASPTVVVQRPSANEKVESKTSVPEGAALNAMPVVRRLEASRTPSGILECASRVMFLAGGFSMADGEMRVRRPDIAVPECKSIRTGRNGDEIVMSMVPVGAASAAEQGDPLEDTLRDELMMQEAVPGSSELAGFILRAAQLASTDGASVRGVETTLWESRGDYVQYRVRFHVDGSTMSALTWLYDLSRLRRTNRVVDLRYSEQEGSAEIEVYSMSTDR